MKLVHFSDRLVAMVFVLTLMIVSVTAVIGQVAGGTGVSTETQRSLGLVTVNGGCSGTLLNQFWVLTARHCVTVDGNVSTAFWPADQLRVTAAWTRQAATVSRIHDFAINSVAGSARNRDIVLLYLGSTNLGEVGKQRIFVVTRGGKVSGRLSTTDTVTQYGRGYSTFATDMSTPSAGLGVYRSAVLSPSAISATHYDLVMNGGNQSGHGGDSGGPSVVTVYGRPDGGVAGVQSTCAATGYVPGAPREWLWATGISLCTYVSTEPFLNEISAAIKETPPKTPFITASPVIRPSLFHPVSFHLSWEGGPAHPNAQVWVSINGGSEIQGLFGAGRTYPPELFRLPKAAFELLIPRELKGTVYKFTLKDGTKALSSVAVPIP